MSENVLECIVSNVYEREKGALVILDPAGDKMVPVTVSKNKGRSIELGRTGKDFKRPLTHELMLRILGNNDIEIESVLLTSLRGSTIIGELRLEENGERTTYDARPSDGIALAVRTGAKILISKQLVKEIGVSKEKLKQKRNKKQERSS